MVQSNWLIKAGTEMRQISCTGCCTTLTNLLIKIQVIIPDRQQVCEVKERILPPQQDYLEQYRTKINIVDK